MINDCLACDDTHVRAIMISFESTRTKERKVQEKERQYYETRI